MSEPWQSWYQHEPVPAGARCARHPDVGAVLICTRCGSFACEACVATQRDPNAAPSTICVSCAGPWGLFAGASWWAIAAVLCAFGGLGCGITAPFGLVLGVVDLVRIQAKQAPPGGRTLDLLAIGIGLVAIVIWVLVAQRILDPGTDWSSTSDDPFAP